MDKSIDVARRLMHGGQVALRSHGVTALWALWMICHPIFQHLYYGQATASPLWKQACFDACHRCGCHLQQLGEPLRESESLRPRVMNQSGRYSSGT